MINKQGIAFVVRQKGTSLSLPMAQTEEGEVELRAYRTEI
jgi:hypothetical protein